MSNIVRIPAAATTPAAVADYQKQNDLLFAFGLWGMQAYPIDIVSNFVLKGAIFNVGGVLYKASANEGITGTPSEYVKLTPISAGAQCSAAYVANLSGVTWSDTYNGYVDGSGNLYLFDEAKAFKNGAVTSPKTFSGKVFQNIPHGQTRITSGSGNFTVPAGVYGIFVELIGGGGGGGNGGNGGGAGQASGGGGGGGGSGGAPGWQYLSVTPGQAIAYSCGAGGAAGLPGGATTFAGLTSAVNGSGGGNGGNGASTGGLDAIGGTSGSGGAAGAGGPPGMNGGPGGGFGYYGGNGGNGGNGGLGTLGGPGGGGGGGVGTVGTGAGGGGGSGAGAGGSGGAGGVGRSGRVVISW